MSARDTALGPRTVVVGGGFAGLATAGLLARDGHRVTLLERGAVLGGRAGRWSEAGFTFDTGPSWYLMPEVIDRWFRLMGTSAAERLDLRRLDPGYRVYFEGHLHEPPVDVRTGHAETLFESLEPGAGCGPTSTPRPGSTGSPRSTSSTRTSAGRPPWPTRTSCAPCRPSGPSCWGACAPTSRPASRTPGCARSWATRRSSSARPPTVPPPCTT